MFPADLIKSDKLSFGWLQKHALGLATRCQVAYILCKEIDDVRLENRSMGSAPVDTTVRIVLVPKFRRLCAMACPLLVRVF